MRSRSLAVQSLVARLATLPGVDRALHDDRANVVVLICNRSASRADLAEAADRHVQALGLGGTEVEFTVRSEHRQAGRVRFVAVERRERPDHTIELTVRLEWQGSEVSSSAVSQPGEAPELRGAAAAALDAACRVVGPELQARVAGIKRVRSFDADLMVASVSRPGLARRPLIGAVVVGDDPYRAACVAVLSALNRVLGNYLSR